MKMDEKAERKKKKRRQRCVSENARSARGGAARAWQQRARACLALYQWRQRRAAKDNIVMDQGKRAARAPSMWRNNRSISIFKNIHGVLRGIVIHLINNGMHKIIIISKTKQMRARAWRRYVKTTTSKRVAWRQQQQAAAACIIKLKKEKEKAKEKKKRKAQAPKSIIIIIKSENGKSVKKQRGGDGRRQAKRR